MMEFSEKDKHDLMDKIKDAVYEAIVDSMPSVRAIEEAIRNGVAEGMPYPSQMLDAVYQANKKESKG